MTSTITDNILSYLYVLLQCLIVKKKVLTVFNKNLIEFSKNYENFVSTTYKGLRNLQQLKPAIISECPFIIQIRDYIRNLMELFLKKYEEFYKNFLTLVISQIESMIRDLNIDESNINTIYSKIQKEYINYKANIGKNLVNREKIISNLDKIKENLNKTTDDPSNFSKHQAKFLALRIEETNINEACLDAYKKYKKYIEDSLDIVRKTINSYKEKDTNKTKDIKENLIGIAKIYEKSNMQVLEFLEYGQQINVNDNFVLSCIHKTFINIGQEQEIKITDLLIDEIINQSVNGDKSESFKEFRMLNKEELVIFKEPELKEIFKEDEFKYYTEKLEFLKVNSKRISIKNVDSRTQHDGVFFIDSDENFIESFSCALNEKILLQGKIYVTNKKLVFYSWFNNSTLFGKTLIEIMHEDITNILKLSGNLFDNSMIIVTKTTKFEFGSVIKRDSVVASLRERVFTEHGLEIPQTGDNISVAGESKDLNKNKIISRENSEINTPPRLSQSLVDLEVPKSKSEPISSHNSLPNSLSNSKGTSPERKKEVLIIESKIEKNVKETDLINKLILLNGERLKKFNEENKRNFHTTPVLNQTLGESPPSIIFKCLYDPDEVCLELKKGKNFVHSYMEIQQNYNISFNKIDLEKWNSKIPKYIKNPENYLLSTLESAEGINDYLENSPYEMIEYKYIYTHPILKKQFMGPSKLEVDDLFRIYFVSPLCLIIEIEGHLSGFMLMDTFYTILQYKFDFIPSLENGRIVYNAKISANYQLEFTKTNMFKDKVKTQSTAEIENTVKTFMIPNIIKCIASYKNNYVKGCLEYTKDSPEYNNNDNLENDIINKSKVEIIAKELLEENVNLSHLNKVEEEQVEAPSNPPSLDQNKNEDNFFTGILELIKADTRISIVIIFFCLVFLSFFISKEGLFLISINIVGFNMIMNKQLEIEERIRNLDRRS